jgi:hypothetical protein
MVRREGKLLRNRSPLGKHAYAGKQDREKDWNAESIH